MKLKKNRQPVSRLSLVRFDSNISCFRDSFWFTIAMALIGDFLYYFWSTPTQLDVIVELFVATDGHVRHAQLKGVMRPILELGPTLGSFVTDEKVRKQHASRVRRDEDQDVPKTVQIREVDPGPGVAEHPVIDPANDGQHQDGGVSHSQPVHALILDAKKWLLVS